MNTVFNPDDYISAQNWIEKKLEELSDGKFKFYDEKPQKEKYKKEFWRIVENKKWQKKLKFHFELYWYGQTSITKAKKITVYTHLECQYFNDEYKNKEIRKHFGLDNGNTLARKVIVSDFSTEESTIKTLIQVIKTLESEEFQKYARIANRLCQMNVKIYSRKEMEKLLQNDFPENTAVISFYDPALKRCDKDYKHIDYSGKCSHVFYSETDDLDIGYLGEKGLTYDTYFTEADEIAEFIYQAYNKNMDIICQCEYGQSRSAGCAAAILEHFYKSGIWVFADYRYYPNQIIFNKMFDALKNYSDKL